ncbi:Putative structural protein [Cellulophaga phage phi14:2]|uniref:Structural protein n=1 Tax=Cellulophaga phage phi14:2 TaxID=1327990 RepID=S0A421_9CAUD|nr:Putative structural protein [Cellulophaga phage phi14:2]AGO48978.1 structural protein [Cellulophaga phage phi14:2]
MTVSELKNEFNILYDSISSNSAPGIDDYEMSVFLTKAQLELVKSKFEPLSNKLQRGFEGNTKRRNDLKELIRDYKTSLERVLNKHVNSDSQFFALPSDVLYPIQEQAILVCNGKNKTVTITPKTHDEYNIQIENPFRKPYNKEVWRMDYSSKEAGNDIVELISDSKVKEYNLRYLKTPDPIIISDLTVFGEGLSINGKTSPSIGDLTAFHTEILDRAVELANRAYRENSLQSNVQLNTRNE